MSKRWRLAAAVVGIVAIAVLVVVWPVFFGGGGPAAPSSYAEVTAGTAFVDVTATAGFTHVHRKPILDAKLEPIMSWMASVGAAAAVSDYDGDGWMDLYATSSRKGEPNRLYRNQGDGTFVDVAAAAGVAAANDDDGVSTDCVWGDLDNDGDPDLFVVRWGRDLLYRNQGDGTFEDVTLLAFTQPDGEPGSPWANGCTAIWFDLDGDSFLDLYVGNYFAPLDLWHLPHTRIMHDDFERSRNAGRNFFFHNEGDGTFVERAVEMAVDDTGWTLSVGHGDLNNDGWQDLYCANDFGPDQLFLGTSDGRLVNHSERAMGYDTEKGMNVDLGDFDGDGWLDVHVANITTAEYLQEGNMLWRNFGPDEEGVPSLVDIGLEAGVYDGGWGWGAKFADFDNDGDLDIFGANGFISAGPESFWYDLASWTVLGKDVTDAGSWPPIGDRSFSGSELVRLWRNDGNEHFTEIAERAGLADRSDNRGVVMFDHDNDGDLDLYLANQGAAPTFHRNDMGSRGHWLGFSLVGRPPLSNRDAIGARVTVVTASGTQIRELDGGNSYCGQSDRRLFFGLGDDTWVSAVQIRWPSRREQVLDVRRVDHVIHVEEPAELHEVGSLIPTTAADPGVRVARPPPPPVVPAAEREAILAELEELVRRQPEDVALASRYRKQCVRVRDHDRSIAFFEALSEGQPTVRNVRLQLSLAYVDAIPTCGGVATIVCKGTFARRSLDQLDPMVAADPTWWPALYSRAMNHLHWPKALLHTDQAIEDFHAVLALQAGSEPRSYHVRTYIGLGDAQVKGGDLTAALETWEAGWAAFPGNPELAERRALADVAAAEAFVAEVRNLEQQIDTDFSFLLDP